MAFDDVVLFESSPAISIEASTSSRPRDPEQTMRRTLLALVMLVTSGCSDPHKDYCPRCQKVERLLAAGDKDGAWEQIKLISTLDQQEANDSESSNHK
jgi:hypothetical protein